MITHILIFILASIGFLIAARIHHHKQIKKPLICPMRLSCDAVVHCEYNCLFGVPVEELGMGYYAVTVVLYGCILAGFGAPALLVVFLSATAFFFSLYLIAIQAFVIRVFCSWCLFSAFISTAIFCLAILG